MKLLNFVANWATPCQEYTPYLQTLCLQQNVPLETIDVEHDLEGMVENFGIDSVPYVILLNDSLEVVERIEGFEPIRVKIFLENVSNQLRVANDDYSSGSTSAVSSYSSLDDRLNALIATAPLMLFIKGTPSSPACGFTRKLLTLLSSHGYTDFKYFDILSDEVIRESLKKKFDWKTYPMIFVKGEFIGGLDIVNEILSSGEKLDLSGN